MSQRPISRASVLQWFWDWMPFLLISIGVVRIVSTYGIISQTWDEGAHLGCGIEWLDQGRYTYEPKHPPLTRIFMAIGPYLDGSRSHHTADDWLSETDQILYAGSHFRTLTLARIGMLPFFILTCALVWLWTRHLFGRPAALVAVLIVTNIPPLLGHAGLATMDIGVPGTLSAALFAFTFHLERPSWKRAALLGLAVAAAVMTKYSTVAFIPLCFLGFLAFRALWNRWFRQSSPRNVWLHAIVCGAVFCVACLAVYRFSWDPIVRPQKDFASSLKSAKLKRIPPVVLAAMEKPIPGGQIIRGFGSLYLNNDKGLPSYLFGEYRENGWWYFFEVVLAVKTPLAFLLLAGIGCVLLLRRSGEALKTPYPLAPMIFAAIILVFCMGSRINLGVRHVLIVYPLLSIAAAFGVVEWWQRGKGYRYAVLALVAWLVIATSLAHPDYMAYFNEFAGGRPERILLESDLDWGQDLHRASLRLRQLGAAHVAVSYFGTERLNELPNPQQLTSCHQKADWALVSYRMLAELKRKGENRELYSCLAALPSEKIGKSMLLYRLLGESKNSAPPENSVLSPQGHRRQERLQPTE